MDHFLTPLIHLVDFQTLVEALRLVRFFYFFKIALFFFCHIDPSHVVLFDLVGLLVAEMQVSECATDLNRTSLPRIYLDAVFELNSCAKFT